MRLPYTLTLHVKSETDHLEEKNTIAQTVTKSGLSYIFYLYRVFFFQFIECCIENIGADLLIEDIPEKKKSIFNNFSR